jgi:hypothetical protein
MHKIIRLSQVICVNGSRKLFRFRVRRFSGLKYYFMWEITLFRNLFSLLSRFPVYRGSFLGRFYVYIYIYIYTQGVYIYISPIPDFKVPKIVVNDERWAGLACEYSSVLTPVF